LLQFADGSTTGCQSSHTGHDLLATRLTYLTHYLTLSALTLRPCGHFLLYLGWR